MDSPLTSTEDTLQTLLVRTAVMQAHNDAILAALRGLQEGQDALRKEFAVLRDAQVATQVSVGILQTEVGTLKERLAHHTTQMDERMTHHAAQMGERMTYHAAQADERMTYYATKADVESVRSELYKALEAQTWRLLVWLTAVCSGLTGAVYYIARNVH